MGWLSGFFAFALLAAPATSKVVDAGYTRAELVTQAASVAPGSSFYAALRLVPDPHWHVYWVNPGDAGMPPALEWQVADGITPGEIAWPYPERIEVPPLASYGYSGETYFLVPMQVEKGARVGDSLRLKVAADWLVCREECLPEQALLEAKVVVGKPMARESQAEAFAEAFERLPVPDSSYRFGVSYGDSLVVLEAQGPLGTLGPLPESGEMLLFPEEPGVIVPAAQQRFQRVSGGFRLEMTRDQVMGLTPDTLAGILVVGVGAGEESDRRALVVTAARGSPFGPQASSGQAKTVSMVNATAPGLALGLLFAFLGGIILNLMPCVLPVLSLKVLDFVKKSGESRRSTLTHGGVFTLGVLFSFWVLAGTLIALRAGGQQLGWGFQLQSPLFVLFLSGFLFLFALNLLGIFEIGTIFTRVQVADKGSALSGSFLSGVTATVVATPCTAPFMGAALGLALTLPAWANLLLFTALALGMASPYLLLSAFPGLLRFLPAPGAWMETLKQFMGFLLLATVLWLAWVLEQLAGGEALLPLMAAFLLLALGSWILGRWGTWDKKPSVRISSALAGILIWAVGLGVGAGLLPSRTSTPLTTAAPEVAGRIAWKPFSQEALDRALQGDAPVFVNFTAAWCLSCKVNERVALDDPEVVARFEELGILALKADWTRRDPQIAKVLAGYGRSGIPLYVLYPGNGREPELFPELLTPGLVLNRLTQMTQRSQSFPNQKKESS